MKTFHGMLLLGCSALALAGCGADDIASPGADSVTINNPTPAPSPTPTPTSGGSVVAAASCPSFNATGGLTDSGIISGPEGTWRVCTLPALVDVSSSLPKVPGVLYRLNGRVDVGCDGGFSAPTSAAPFATTTASCGGRTLTADTNVTLTIDPGVIVYGENGSEAAWLAVNRGNKINAVGTASSPIIFTSRQNVIGTNDDTSQGQWGGIVLLGRGVVTDCAYGAAATTEGGTGSCERDTEGAVNKAVFGGNNNAYNAGSLKYVQIRYSGFVLGANSELQALTTGGVGTGTTFDYVQSVNSSDDGAEFFGGAVNFKHYVAVNADDDSLDIDTGLQGSFQHVLILQRNGGGDAFIEADSNGAEANFPRHKTTISNFTFVQPSASSNNDSGARASVHIRGNADITLANGVIVSPNNECIRMTGSGTTPATLTARSVVMSCNAAKYLGDGAYTAATTQSQFGSGSNNNNDSFTPTLTNVFVNGSNENAVPVFDVTTLSSFFGAATNIGAVTGASDTWYRGWTCDNATANFGSGSACTALPTT